MDTDVEELRQEVEELKKITADTNRTVRGMARAARWGTIFRIVWWLTIAGVTGTVYYLYVQPYVAQIMGTYDNAKDFQVQLQDWFAQFGHNNPQ